MMAEKCFELGCMNEVEYLCKCSSPETLSCEVHIRKHVSLPNRAHNLESMFIQTCEGTKEAILEFLTIENSKYSELRRKIIDSFSQCPFNLKRNLRDSRKKLDDCSGEINDFFTKISQVKKLSKLEQDPILWLLVLQPREAVEKLKLMTIDMKDWYNGARFCYIVTEKLASLNRSFVKEKCDAYQENMNMQNTPEVHNKTSKPANIEPANVNDSISLIINNNNESLKGPENVEKPIKKSFENKTSLLYSQIKTASNDINNKSKEAESILNVIDSLRNKRAEIFSRPNNPELEIDFRATCSAIQTNSSLYDPPLMQTYQDYINAYQQKTSLYNITWDKTNRTNLIIYNTETETQEEIKTLQTLEPLDSKTCITQLPNGKLFCFSNYRLSGITMLIDLNGGVEVLPSGTTCRDSSCIYFNNSVYCFGEGRNNCLTLSSRFDLDRNRWIQLTPMPQVDDRCNSIIFNRNILISGFENRKLWLYSIDIDSFSTIPYEFEGYKRKILINAERLYLIECGYGSIYESETGSYWNWRRVGKSKIISSPSQVYCSYNKGGIYISASSGSMREYYYFNLDQKIIIDSAYYNEHVSLRRVGEKIEAIKWNNEEFKLDPYYLDEWNLKGKPLNTLGENLEAIECFDESINFNPNEGYLYALKANAFYKIERYLEAIECFDEAIKCHPDNPDFYGKKGNAFYNLERYLEAIECFDKAIKLDPNDASLYNDKACAFYHLESYLEATECFDEAIKLDPSNASLYNDKACAFYRLKRYLEATECFDEAIKLDPSNADFYWMSGSALNKLGRYSEAVESDDKAIKINPTDTKFYNRKGNTLYVLERYQEAIQCYDEAIELEPNNPLHFCNRARVFHNLRQEEAALQDFNTAYNLKQENLVNGVFTGDEWELSKKDIDFINDVLGRERIELLQKMKV